MILPKGKQTIISFYRFLHNTREGLEKLGQFIVSSKISNARKSVSSDFQTPRTGFKKRRAADFVFVCFFVVVVVVVVVVFFFSTNFEVFGNQ